MPEAASNGRPADASKRVGVCAGATDMEQSALAASRQSSRQSASQSFTSQPRLRRMNTKKVQKMDVDWQPMIDNGEYEIKHRIIDHEEVRRHDKERKVLLGLSRNVSPIDTVIRLGMLPRTVIPRIIVHPTTWIVLGCFAISAIVTRCGVSFGSEIPEFDGGSTIMTFMVIFYMSYCYSRYTSQLDEVQAVQHSIIDACTMCRVVFTDPDEVHRVWRYLNMMHAAAYTALTTSYSKDNFFDPIAEKHKLVAPDAKGKEIELKALAAVNLDGEDNRACLMLQVWVLEVIKNEARNAPDIPPPICKSLYDEIQKLGLSVKQLFAYQYQVLPFIYTHLVSFSCFLLLLIASNCFAGAPLYLHAPRLVRVHALPRLQRLRAGPIFRA